MSAYPPPYDQKMGDPTMQQQQPYYQGPPQQTPYPPTGMQQPTTTVYVNQPMGQRMGHPVALANVVYQNPCNKSESPQNVMCPHCNCQVISTVTYQDGTLTWLLCLVIFLFVGFLGCCLIPFCVTSCKDAIHTCPNCNNNLGTLKRM